MGHLPSIYYLISWKGYPKDESTWEPTSKVQYLRKLVSIFYKNYLNKPKATFLFIYIALPMAKSIVPPRPMLMASKSVFDPLAVCRRRQSISLLLTNQPLNLGSVSLHFFSFLLTRVFGFFINLKESVFFFSFHFIRRFFHRH